MVPMTYKGLDNEEELKMVPVTSHNNNNYNYVVSHSEGNDVVNENLFDKDVDDEVEASSKTNVNLKVVRAIISIKSHTMRVPTKLSKKWLKKGCKEDLFF